jgi:hypothetical protein
MILKRGRRTPVYTRRTMRLAIALHRALAALGAAPAVSSDYVSAVMAQSTQGWICWLNQQLGDCVCEDSGHALMLRTANASKIVIPTTQDIMTLYEAVGGYVPGNASTDQGCDETAMCQYMVTNGLCGQKASATGPLDPTNMDHLKWSVQIFGSCRLGIIVDQQMEQQFSSGQPWTTPAAANDPNAGGHDVPIVKYDAEYAYVVTWGGLQPVAWPLVANSQFLDEAHCDAWEDWMRAGGTAPSGFDLAGLLADLQQIEAQEAA